MSEYMRIETQFKDADTLHRALAIVCAEHGIPFEAGVRTAHGYRGETENVEFVIRKVALRSYGDLGFQRLPNGSFQVIIDDLDLKGAEIVRQTKRRYARLQVEKIARARGMRVEEIEDNGVIRLRLYPTSATRRPVRARVRR